MSKFPQAFFGKSLKLAIGIGVCVFLVVATAQAGAAQSYAPPASAPSAQPAATSSDEKIPPALEKRLDEMSRRIEQLEAELKAAKERGQPTGEAGASNGKISGTDSREPSACRKCPSPRDRVREHANARRLCRYRDRFCQHEGRQACEASTLLRLRLDVAERKSANGNSSLRLGVLHA